MTHHVVALVPIKDFQAAKGRLRTELGDEAASELARTLAANVLSALHPLPVLVVTDNDTVSEFAQQRGATVQMQQREGLNAAVSEGYLSLVRTAEQVVIVHSDLAHPEGLGSFSYEDGITIWTDMDQEGTNVMCLPTGLPFTFSYGEGSALRHRSHAREQGFEPRWITNSPWALDIDEPRHLI